MAVGDAVHRGGPHRRPVLEAVLRLPQVDDLPVRGQLGAERTAQPGGLVPLLVRCRGRLGLRLVRHAGKQLQLRVKAQQSEYS